MNKINSAIAGAVIGAILAYPLSYFFQPGALRAKISLGKYIEVFSDIIGNKDLQSTVILSFVISIAVAAAIGFAVGRTADQKK